MEVQSNYFYNHYNPVTDQKLSRQYILPDSTYFYDQNSRTDNRSNSHRFNLTYDYLDRFHEFYKIYPNAKHARIQRTTPLVHMKRYQNN